MALIVQKFGGSSVKDRDRIFNVARIVANTHNAGNEGEDDEEFFLVGVPPWDVRIAGPCRFSAVVT